MRHTKKKILPLVFASGLLASSFTQAAQLGKLEVLSGADEPFLAEIQVDQVSPEERASLQAKLASPEAFKAARLAIDPNLKNLQFAIQNGRLPGTALVKITSAQPLPAGFMDTLLELTWAGGRVAREYTLTVPASAAKAAGPPASSLPEIRPPMTPPPVAATPKPPAATAPTPSNVEKPAEAEKPAPQPVPESSVNVVRGDTLSELAMKLVGEGVTLNQAMAAIYEANKAAFIKGSVHLIREGAQIQVPNRTALRARNANEALLVLAQNDDRNVYSAYARQIGLLTVDKQVVATASTSAQGKIAPQEPAPKASATPPADRLQIAPGAAQGKGNTDENAEELVAKNKALADANERIALLEKNVSDLQRLLDMQKELGETSAGAPSAGEPALPASGTDPAADPNATQAPLVDVPSETLGDENPVEGEADGLASPAAPVDVTEGVQAPVAEAPAEAPPFDWMPWILAGAGGFVAVVVALLIARARRNKVLRKENSFDAEDDASFSEVNEYDEAAVAASAVASTTAVASAGTTTDRASGLNQSENSDFDLDEVLNDPIKPADPAEVIEPRAPVVQAQPEEQVERNIPDLNDVSEEAAQQKDSLDSEVSLDFPEEEVAAPKTSSILDDLDEIEKGTLAAQEELDEIRKNPALKEEMSNQDIDAAFDDLVDSGTTSSEADTDPEKTESPAEPPSVASEDVFDQAIVDLDVDVPNPKVDDATWQEVATKLDLAGAYVEIGDADGAKELLNEIVKKGDVDQVRKAKALLATLN